MDSHETPKDDFELEVSDIPRDDLPPIPEALVTLGAQFSPRSHAWRLSTVVGTIFLSLSGRNARPGARRLSGNGSAARL